MAPRDTVRALALSRIAVGAGALIAPGPAAGALLGAGAASPAATVLGRALGARDALIGGMVLHTVDHPQVGRRWLMSCAAVDLVDGVAALLARDGLPRGRGAAFAAVALGSAVAHGLLAQRLTSAEGLQSVAARTPPAPASSPEAVMPDGADEAKRAMGARTIGVDTPK